jgi:CspA family cold shock protein
VFDHHLLRKQCDIKHLSSTRSKIFWRFTMAEREVGTVKWFHNGKGYGFITREEGEDIFVHYSEIEMEGYKKLEEGQEVEFTVAEGDKGLQAQEVIPI